MATVVAPTRIALDNILVATDFSGGAKSAVRHALGLAQRHRSTLHLVNVLPRMPFVEAAEPDPERERSHAKQEMANLVSGLQNVKQAAVVEEGAVKEVLSDLTRTKAIDLIVLATAGRNGIGKFLLGSVAEEVSRSATCPVLTVGPRVTRGVGGVKLQHILLATNFGPESAHGVVYALLLAEENQARLTLLHVVREPGVTLPRPGGDGSTPGVNPYDEVRRGEKLLRDLVPPDMPLTHEPEYRVQFGWPVETILRVASEDVDMIVLGAKRPAVLTKYFGGGVAYRVMRAAPCPVLTAGASVRAWSKLAPLTGAPYAA
jgi:nucleotide-binding universal stress UspA family protein